MACFPHWHYHSWWKGAAGIPLALLIMSGLEEQSEHSLNFNPSLFPSCSLLLIFIDGLEVAS